MVSPGQWQEVAAALAADQARLFGLADQLVAAQPSRQWDVLVSDECSAHFLPRFLSRVLQQCIGPESVPALQVGVAHTYEVAYAGSHRETIQQYLSTLPLRDARILQVTDLVMSGFATGSIASMLQGRRPHSLDIAVLLSNHDPALRQWERQGCEIYIGESVAGDELTVPAMYGSIIGTGSGMRSVHGHATPQSVPGADLALAAHIGQAFDSLADTYAISRR